MTGDPRVRRASHLGDLAWDFVGQGFSYPRGTQVSCAKQGRRYYPPQWSREGFGTVSRGFEMPTWVSLCSGTAWYWELPSLPAVTLPRQRERKETGPLGN
jgi:hypothetical protein